MCYTTTQEKYSKGEWKEVRSLAERENVIRMIDENEYKMDYSQLKTMTEDRTEWATNWATHTV